MTDTNPKIPNQAMPIDTAGHKASQPWFTFWQQLANGLTNIGVKSLNSLTGAINLVAGTNISLVVNPTADTITINAIVPPPIPGPPGPPGSSVFQIMAGMDGMDGEDGWTIPGLPGAPGATGATGPPGLGVPGFDGDEGPEGFPIPGPAGSAGATGPAGPAGPAGFGFSLDGADGEDAILIGPLLNVTGAVKPGQNTVFGSPGQITLGPVTTGAPDAVLGGNVGVQVNLTDNATVTAFEDSSTITQASYSGGSSYNSFYAGPTLVNGAGGPLFTLTGLQMHSTWTGPATGGNGSALYGFLGESQFNGSGTLDNMYANNSTVLVSAGTVTNAYGYSSGFTNNATVTNFYAFYDAVDGSSAATNPHGFYQAATNHPNFLSSTLELNYITASTLAYYDSSKILRSVQLGAGLTLNGGILSSVGGLFAMDGNDGDDGQMMPSPVQVPVTVPNGGTGDTTLTAHGVLVGAGTSAVAVTGAGTAGQLFTSGGASADPAFTSPLQAATVVTAETTTSTTYTDLATTGPSVTMTLKGTTAIIWLAAKMDKTVASVGNTSYMSVAVSGASTVTAIDDNSIQLSYPVSSSGFGFSMARVLILTGLTAGSNTFTAKYRVDGSTFQFFDRSIAVFAP